MASLTMRAQVEAWNEKVEEGPLDEQAERPFEAGLHLAAADVIDNYERARQIGESGDLAAAVNRLRETLYAVIAQGGDA